SASVGGLLPFRLERQSNSKRRRPLFFVRSRQYGLLYAIKFSRSLRFEAHIGPMQTIRRFLADESGATAIEYGLIAAGISLAIIAVVNGIGVKLNTKFSSINSSLK